MEFIKKPNLPKGQASTVIISKTAAELFEQKLRKLNIEALIVGSCPDLAGPVSDHPDMQLLHTGGRTFVLAANSALLFDTQKIGMNAVYAEKLKHDYPDDIMLNAAILDDKMFCLKKHISKKLFEFPFKVISVKQGYSKCSICVVDENSIITEDLSIHEAAMRNGIASLLITKGYVSIDGYDYGFIGGATGKLSENLLAFTGKIDSHPDKDKILNFIDARNIKPLFLTDKDIFDVGSIIPVKESLREVLTPEQNL
ncbi:MAG: hypothetical protein Q8865_02365 [Bacillota bacterium]|nr:hypothetical protein [Bacillota bacterium]